MNAGIFNIRKTFFVGAALSWALYVVFLITENNLAADLVSPITCLFVILCIGQVMLDNKTYRIAILFMMLGVGFWFVGDVFYLLFYNGFLPYDYIEAISTGSYQFTSYAYAVGIILFTWVEYRNKDIFRLVANAFLFSIATYILTNTFFSFIMGTSLEISKITYSGGIGIVVAMFIVVLMMILLTDRGLKNVTSFGILILLSFLIYGALDTRYTYIKALEMNAESDFNDVMFLLSIVILGAAFSRASINRFLEEYDKRQAAKTGKLGIIMDFILVGIGVFLAAVGAMGESSLLILIITGMAYLLLSKTIQVNELNRRLIARQEEEKERLAYQVSSQEEKLSEARQKLEDASYVDSMTGLRNRSYWNVYSNKIINSLKNKKMFLYAIDVNFFKIVNETYGHNVGDSVLLEIAHRLEELSDDNITVFRVGGDQFMVACVGDDRSFNKHLFTEILLDTLDKNYDADVNSIRVTFSVGMSAYPEDTRDLDKLLNFAESARNSVKHRNNKSTFASYDVNIIPKMRRVRCIEQRLQNVDYNSSFEMYYQPQVLAASGKLIGMEALIRWKDREYGFISPAEFIPIAEKNGMMSGIGKWISEQSMKQIKQWNEKYKSSLVCGINVSPIQLRENSFVDDFLDIMQETKVPSEWLDVEITEGIALNGISHNTEIINRLKAANLTLSVDDFGTGYAAFANMISFQFDRIKIAKELVDDLALNNNAKVVVKAIIDMAKGMSLNTIAEGVEYKEQLDILVELGCDQIQGYYFGKPLPPDEFEETWLV
ncbi:MAG: EAL domain-containing protein [Lachnospiraceae bacterium]|nr:EAL domain-containing protein [Lachnospiraceae bacterium]